MHAMNALLLQYHTVSPTNALLPPHLGLHLLPLDLQPALPRRPLNLLQQLIIMLRIRLWSPQRRRQRVLFLVSVLEEGEEGVDLGGLFFRRGFGQYGELGGVFALLFGRRDGRDAVWNGAALDCAGEGEGGAEEVFGPGGEDAGVVFGYCLWRRALVAIGVKIQNAYTH
jgi:hypothetical protein